MSDKIKVCHITSAHERDDIRIFLKQCRSLQEAGYNVTYIVADGKGDEIIDNIQILDAGERHSRLKRMLITTKKVYKRALEVDADIYQFHDPELMPYGLKLQKQGKKVMFDSHEDLPIQILSKPYLVKPFAIILSRITQVYENWVCSRLSGVIAATPFIRDKFLKVNKKSVDINNFPMLEEFYDKPINWKAKEDSIVYIGAISRIRGIGELISALNHTADNVRLNVAGKFIDRELEADVKSKEEWLTKVNDLGYLDRDGIIDVLTKSKIGMVTLHPRPNYLDSLPIKMFEYMNAGIPVIASNFPYWEKIIKENNCGLTVNPFDPKAIGKTISYLMNEDRIAKELGENGRKAVYEKFNWGVESKKLISLYQSL